MDDYSDIVIKYSSYVTMYIPWRNEPYTGFFGEYIEKTKSKVKVVQEEMDV